MRICNGFAAPLCGRPAAFRQVVKAFKFNSLSGLLEGKAQPFQSARRRSRTWSKMHLGVAERETWLKRRPQGRITALIGLAGLICLLQATPRLHAADDVVMKAMRDELNRSMQKLQLEKLEKPYFISYRVVDATDHKCSASFGSLLDSTDSRARVFSVQVRVGSYALDNTNFQHSHPPYTVNLPLEDDYRELRRQMWLATDGAYKDALEDLARKRAALQTEKRQDETPDFTQEKPSALVDEALPASWNRAQAEDLVRRLSGLFRQMPEVYVSAVHLEASNVRTFFLNSEGTTYSRFEPLVFFAAMAHTQAPDGRPLDDLIGEHGRTMSELPPPDALATRIREMGERLKKVRAAPLLDRYNGPVLFEGQEAARVINRFFAAKLLARRQPVMDSARNVPRVDDSFLDKIDARVLPATLTVTDDPTRSTIDGQRLFGGYRVDDDGVPSRPTPLIAQGILKTLLAARDPVRSTTHSTGNERGSGVMVSNLLVVPEAGSTVDEMRRQLRQMVKQRNKEYGIVVDAEGLTYKLFPDGRQELVRNAQLAGITPETFREIAAASKSVAVVTNVFGTSTGAHLYSVAAPALLFEDLTLRTPPGEIPQPPLSKNPYSEK